MNTQPGIQAAMPWAEGPVPLQPVDNTAPPLPDLDSLLPQDAAEGFTDPAHAFQAQDQEAAPPPAAPVVTVLALVALRDAARKYLDATDAADRTPLEHGARIDLLAAIYDAELCITSTCIPDPEA